MKQRLCLGRSLIHNPSVLILDEPAAGLDPRARIELKEMIGSLAAEGKSILISSHILTELAEMCDRVAIIEHGNMLGVGTVKEILGGLHGLNTDGLPSTAQATLLVEVTDNAEGLASWLQEQGLQSVQLKGMSVQVVLGDCPREQAELLRQMVFAGFSISKFSAKERTLEEAFLHVTRGRVQ
jgi:ABC-2 type transport system ATP-binding protein